MSDVPLTPARVLNGWRIAGWGILGALLVLPALAMQFTREVNWTALDFVFAAVLLGALGAGFEIAFRIGRNRLHTIGLIIAALTGFLMIWIGGAVGIVGREDEPPGLLFLAMVVIGAVASLAVRFRPLAMRTIAAALAAGTLALGAGAHAMLAAADKWGPVLMFTVLWSAAAASFHAAARSA